MIERISRHEYRVDFGMCAKPYTPENLHAALKWCEETFGPGGRNSKYAWRFGWASRKFDRFYFRKEKDALLFVLRWS